MAKAPATCGDRPPLKDTSRNFVNTQTPAKLLAAPAFPTKKVLPFQHDQQQQHNSQQSYSLTHHRKLNTSDRTPCLMDTSTPKKDGYLPSLTSRINNNNSNTALYNTTTSATSLTTNASLNVKNHQYQTAGYQQIPQNTSNNNNNNNNNTITKKMTGNELSKWQQTWKEILPKSYIYFEHDESNERDKKRAMLALKNLGATIEPFFCENITIIISKRPYNKSFTNYPAGDIFRYAVKKQLKVWNFEKVFRFVAHLGEQIPDIDDYDKIINNRNINNNGNNNNNNNNNNNSNNNNMITNNINMNQTTNKAQLSNMLMNERLFGPSDRDPNVKRNDLKYFTDFYLYIYDITHKTRPVAIREWKDRSSCPRIHHTTNGKSLFVAESKSQNSISILKRHQRRIQCLNDTFAYREIVIQSAYDVDNGLSNIRCPNYNQRIAYKRKWEEIYYKSNPEENPIEKMKSLYMGLNPNEQKQFESFFNKPIDHEESMEILDLTSTNKRQKCDSKLVYEKIANQYENVEIDENDQILNLDDEEEVDNLGDRKLVNDFITTINVDTTSHNQSKNKIVNVAEDNDVDNNIVKVCYNENNRYEKDNTENVNNDNDDDHDHDDSDDDVEDDDDDEDDDDEDDDDDISNLVSDKVDLIDEINTRLVDEAKDDLNSRLSKETAFKFAQMKKMPRLIRQDSLVNGISQNVSGDGKLLCEYGEIAASGIQASGVNPSGNYSHGNTAYNIGNGLAPSKSQVVNKTLANEHKRIVVLTPSLNIRQKPTTIAPLNINKSKACTTVMVADETISETQEQIMGKNSSNKNITTLNEDELAALRSVEAANPFISDGCSKPCKQNHEIKFLKINSKQQKVDNISNKPKNATIGIFKEQKQEKSKNEMRPGYCENCRVKYSDFSEHIWSDKHRSFAEDDSNFKHIDKLIKLLSNPSGL
ncbi:hypothetical protein C6P40_003507 [Pichia californica]|uniref:DBF4-type domain-containing protein n=1 Tax=Pichia californica TaxID=460514 RepID=A0A9P6WQJ3_9ASCO|nr:hypothetical protein C6P42_004753 [[Candida] californica]KAG0691256.1 hypothetical protein C6P40_003507 [[Candida] californica]